jgi:PST family polysaccharide transporter
MANDLTTAAADPASRPSLRQKTTQGVMWVAAQAGATRVVTLVQQVALTWLLSKSDFGVIALAYTVTTLVNLMANPGIDAVLVQRLRKFHLWATPALWLGMAMSVAGAIVMLVAAPIAAWVYEQPHLIGLIAVLALALPLQALQIVPKARLRTQMRFKAVVMLGLVNSVLIAVLTVGFAYFGMGAYSFVVPVPIVAAIVSFANWRLARPTIRKRAEFSRWKYLFGNGMTVGATQLLHTFINQADYMALGLAGLSDAKIGVYMFAFNIAIQPLRLISSNVPVVLFPGLSHLANEPEKQARAALRAMRLLMMVTVPVCMLQILLAEPLFRLVCPPEWLDSVLPCQILTVGLMINAACWPATSLLLAQGRFREQLWIAVIGTVIFLLILAAAILEYPSIISVAVAVGVFHLIYSPLVHWCAVRQDVPRGSFLRETMPPLVAGVGGLVPSLLVARFLPETVAGDMAWIAVGGVLFSAVYLALLYVLVPASVQDFWQQVSPLWRKIWPAKASAA